MGFGPFLHSRLTCPEPFGQLKLAQAHEQCAFFFVEENSPPDDTSNRPVLCHGLAPARSSHRHHRT